MKDEEVAPIETIETDLQNSGGQISDSQKAVVVEATIIQRTR